MEVRDYLSDDGKAMVALCSALALRDGAAEEGPGPFKLSEWNELARQIEASALKRPAELQGQTASEIAKALGIAPDEAERIVRKVGERIASAANKPAYKWEFTVINDPETGKSNCCLPRNCSIILLRKRNGRC